MAELREQQLFIVSMFLKLKIFWSAFAGVLIEMVIPVMKFYNKAVRTKYSRTSLKCT